MDNINNGNIYKTIIDSAAEDIAVADVKTKKLLNINPAFCKMIGYSKEELKQMNIMDIHRKEHIKYVLSEFDAQVKGEKTLAENIPCLRKDGIIFYADIKSKNTNINGIACNVGFFTDVTERVEFQEEQEKLISKLNQALKKVRVLSGILPICASCKDIRDDKGNWQQIEVYIKDRSEADFSHGICPKCTKKLYPEFYKG